MLTGEEEGLDEVIRDATDRYNTITFLASKLASLYTKSCPHCQSCQLTHPC
jgi:hypothetical protein